MADLSESLEDYLESVLILEKELHTVRVRDLMNYFGYKVSSVNSALKILAAQKLVVHERYGDIKLTKEGNAAAQKIYVRHEKLFYFLHTVLGVKKETAYKEACKMEHVLSGESYERLAAFIDKSVLVEREQS